MRGRRTRFARAARAREWVMIAPSALAHPAVRAAVVDILTGLAVVAVALHPNLGGRSAARA